MCGDIWFEKDLVVRMTGGGGGMICESGRWNTRKIMQNIVGYF